MKASSSDPNGGPKRQGVPKRRRSEGVATRQASLAGQTRQASVRGIRSMHRRTNGVEHFSTLHPCTSTRGLDGCIANCILWREGMMRF